MCQSIHRYTPFSKTMETLAGNFYDVKIKKIVARFLAVHYSVSINMICTVS